MWRSETKEMRCSCGCITDFDYSFFFPEKEKSEYGVQCVKCFLSMAPYVLKRLEPENVIDPASTRAKRLAALVKAREKRSAMAQANKDYAAKIDEMVAGRAKEINAT